MRILKFVLLIVSLFAFSLLYLHVVGAADMPVTKGDSVFRETTLYGVKALTPTSNNTGALYVKEITTTKMNATGGVETPSVETPLPSDKRYPDSLSLRNMSDVPAVAYAPANLTKDATYYPTPYIKSISCTNNSVDCEIPYAETFNMIYHSDGQLSSITATFNPECIGQNFIAHANGLHAINITPTNGTSINGVLGTCVQVPPTSVVRLYCTAVGHAFAYPISGTVNYVKLGDMILP